MLFVDFARTVLTMRRQDGIRGIDHEVNRFAVHIESATFAQKPLDAITAVDLRDWIREMQAKLARDTREVRTLDNATIKRAFALVSAIFTCAVERDLLKVSPTHGVKVKKRADERSTRAKWTFLTLDEQKLVASCNAIPYADRLAIRFAIATGLRQGEQFALQLTDLHTGPDSPHAFVRFGSPGMPPKSGKTRSVPLFGDGLTAARRWLYELATFAPDNPRGLVFPYANGGHRGVGKPLGRGPLLRQYLALVGITRRVRWHDLRHTFCTNLVTGALGQTWPLVAVKEMAGHSSVTITERYSHVGQRDLVSLGAACSFAHDAMPALASCDSPPDTQRDVATWFDEAVAS